MTPVTGQPVTLMLQLNWSSESRQVNLSAGNISAKLEVEEDVAFAKPSEHSYTIQWFGPATVVTCCCPQVEFKSAIFQSRVYASNRVIPEPSCSTGAKSSLFWPSDAFGLANARLQCRSSAAKSVKHRARTEPTDTNRAVFRSSADAHEEPAITCRPRLCLLLGGLPVLVRFRPAGIRIGSSFTHRHGRRRHPRRRRCRRRHGFRHRHRRHVVPRASLS